MDKDTSHSEKVKVRFEKVKVHSVRDTSQSEKVKLSSGKDISNPEKVTAHLENPEVKYEIASIQPEKVEGPKVRRKVSTSPKEIHYQNANFKYGGGR